MKSWPLAGFLALILFLAADSVLLGIRGPWSALHERAKGALPRGLAVDQLELRTLIDTPGTRRAIVVGSSRANTGFVWGHYPVGGEERVVTSPYKLPHVSFGKIAHAGIRVLEMVSLVDQVLAAKADAVVLILSEFDLNRPVRTDAHAAFGSFPAIWGLLAEAGIAAAFEHRVDLYRQATSALLRSYRFRPVLHSAFVDGLRRFELDRRFPSVASAEQGKLLVAGGRRKPVNFEERRRIQAKILETFPHLKPRGAKIIYHQIRQITRGPHSEVQAGILRRGLSRLSRAGVKVVIAEAPLHPLSAELYDATIRSDFFDLALNLEKEFEARFVPLEVSGPYRPEDFRDMTHLARDGGAKLTAAIVTAVDEILR